MKRIMSICVAFTAAFLFHCVSSGAQTLNDFGIWGSFQAVKSWNGGAYAMARGEIRTFDNTSACECWFLMAGGGYGFTRWLKADLSYEYWRIPSVGNITQHKAVASVTGTLRRELLAISLREKYELAFTGSGCTHMLRSRLRTQYAFDKVPLTPYIMYEHFGGLDGKGWIRSLHYAGTEIRLSAHSSIDAFYMYHLYALESGTGSAHLLGLGYNLVF